MPRAESGGWWQRPHKRVRCRQCKSSLVENPSFKVASVTLSKAKGAEQVHTHLGAEEVHTLL